MTKFFQWLTAFGALAMMSAFTLFDLTGGAQAVLANVANASSNVVVVDGGGASENSWTQKFARLFEDQLICAVDEHQAADLAARYQSSTEHVTINGKDVSVFKVGGDNDAKRKDILNYLESTSTGDVNCKVVKSRHWFYLLFSAHIS